MLKFRRLIFYAVITKYPKLTINKNVTQSICCYSKQSEKPEKSKDLNQLNSEQLKDSPADGIIIDSKKSEGECPKSISEASQEILRQFSDNVDTELCLTYSCRMCSARNSKTISKLAYLKGVVIVRCDKCQNIELVADNAKWIDDVNGKKNIEDVLAEKGEAIQNVSMQEFFGIKDDSTTSNVNNRNLESSCEPKEDKLMNGTIEMEQTNEKSTFLVYVWRKALLIKQKLSNILTTKQEQK